MVDQISSQATAVEMGCSTTLAEAHPWRCNRNSHWFKANLAPSSGSSEAFKRVNFGQVLDGLNNLINSLTF